MKATAKELRFNSKELLNAVNRGEEVVITFRGKPCAKLVPYKEKNSKTDEKIIKYDNKNCIYGDTGFFRFRIESASQKRV